MASFTAAAGTRGSHTNTTKDFTNSTQIKPLSNPGETGKSPENHPTADIVKRREPLVHMPITPQANVSTVELGTTLPTPELAVPTVRNSITPGADNSVSTAEVGTTSESRTNPLATPSIINHTTVDDNFDGDTSAAGDGLILASTAIIDQDSETSIVNPTRTFLPQITTIGDLPHTVEVNSESQYFVDDQTFAPSLPAITISSTPISLCPYPTSQTIIGSTNVPRWMPLTPPRYYLTSSPDSVTDGYPLLPDVPAASATLGHLPNLSSPTFTSNPGDYTGTNRSSTGTGRYVPGVAVLPTGRAPPSSKQSTPLPLPANAAARMESGARGLFAAAFGLRVCLWWV